MTAQVSIKGSGSQPEHYDILVVGMGPVGLAAAYEASKNGHKVLMIEKRAEEQTMIRPQIVVLDPERKQQLMNMIQPEEKLDDNDIKFLDLIAHSAEIKVAEVQRFVLNNLSFGF